MHRRRFGHDHLGVLVERAQHGFAALVDTLSHEDPYVRVYAAEALASIGPNAVKATNALAEALGEAPQGAHRRLSQWAGRGNEVGVAVGALALPLAVRSRRRGDRFRPLGAPGGRKLQDFLVDRKVPREDRDSLPLVVDRRDRIVWVVGQSVAEDFRVTDPSQGVLLLKVRRF